MLLSFHFDFGLILLGDGSLRPSIFFIMEDRFFKACLDNMMIEDGKDYRRVNMQSMKFQNKIKELDMYDSKHIDRLLKEGKLIECAGTYCIHSDYWPENLLDID